jgi:hypothetical protein
MTLSSNRVLSGVLAAIYLVMIFCFVGAEAGFKAGLFLLLPLACIWFSESMGGYTGPAWRGVITSPTPANFVCIGGWFLLLLPLVIGVLYAFKSTS